MTEGIIKKTAVLVISVLFVLWCGMFVADYLRCTSLKEPLFATAEGTTADDGGAGIYRGLGYTVEVEKCIDVELALPP